MPVFELGTKAAALIFVGAASLAVHSAALAQTTLPSTIPLQAPATSGQAPTTGGETTTPQETETTADKGDDKKGDKEPKLTEEQKNNAELDKALLGAWVYLVPAATNEISNDTATQAITRCIAGERGQSGQSTTAPKSAGDLVFFRTDQGIQAFDGKTGSMRAYPTVLRKTVGNETFWGLRNGNVTRELRFKKIGSQLGEMHLLLESDSIFLRCKNVVDAMNTQ